MNTNTLFDEVFSDSATSEAIVGETIMNSSIDSEINVEEQTEVPPEEPTVSLAESVVTTPANLKYYKGGQRYELMFSGVCSHCAHCGQPLTDAESMQRGIGPVCSKKGYKDEVEPRDDVEAIMALAEFPELADYMVKCYKPKGNRDMVNALVRIASLNRRTPVHAECTDAVDALGYTKLASALRESISSIEIYEVAEKPDFYAMWIKKHDFSWSFWSQLKNQPGVHMTKFPKPATFIPKSQRKELAKLLISHYSGLYIKTPKGSHKITEAWFGKMNS